MQNDRSHVLESGLRFAGLQGKSLRLCAKQQYCFAGCPSLCTAEFAVHKVPRALRHQRHDLGPFQKVRLRMLQGASSYEWPSQKNIGNLCVVATFYVSYHLAASCTAVVARAHSSTSPPFHHRFLQASTVRMTAAPVMQCLSSLANHSGLLHKLGAPWPDVASTCVASLRASATAHGHMTSGLTVETPTHYCHPQDYAAARSQVCWLISS